MSEVPPTRKAYQKPALSYEAQLARLEQRGLGVADRNRALEFLRHANYYRVAGYCLAFETARHVFAAGTTIEQVMELYEFDRVLRDLVSEALEVVEVDLRAALAYYFGQKYGPFGHIKLALFFASRWFDHSQFIQKVREETERSSEEFIEHYRVTYAEYPDLPIWVATEVMSFGALSQMYSGMLRDDQIAAAKRYGVRHEVMASWLHHLVYLRNVCAHHLRLWGRSMRIMPEVPRTVPAWHPPYLASRDRLFASLLVLNQMLNRCPGVRTFAGEWRGRLITHLAKPPKGLDLMQGLGVPANWAAHPLWR